MSRSILLRLSQVVILLILIIPSGCGDRAHRIFYEPDYTNRYYVPKQIPIKTNMILKPEFEICKMVTIMNTQEDARKVPIGAYTHQWWGNLHMWTETAVGVLKNELEKRGVTVTEDAPKILKLSITNANLFWGFDVVGCTLNLQVETGDEYKVTFEETNKSTDLYGSCDGAVTRAVAAMFDDNRMRSYLTCPVVPKDSDGDGVFDDRDECPGTPEGIEVDSKGCPLDTDGDGVFDDRDECPGTPEGIEVDSKGCPLPPKDSDGDGVPDDGDECPGTPEGIEVDSKGCPLDTDGDGVPDYKDECLGTPQGAKVDNRGCWVIMDTLFDFNKYDIKAQYYPVIDDVIAVLKKNPSLKIEIQGYTDKIGAEAYNQKLSENRARSVMNYLVINGIEGKRLSIAGYGFTRPKTTNETEEGRALNRRVELVPVH
jgi:OOP family OmpA-OmpF porin